MTVTIYINHAILKYSFIVDNYVQLIMAGETSKAPPLVRRAVSNELTNQEKQAKRKYVGRCALLDACRNNQPDIVKFLLQVSYLENILNE